MRLLFRLAFGLALLAGLCSGCATTRENQKETAALHLQIATAHIKSQNYPMALKELLLAEENDPTNPLVQANLGLVYFMRDAKADLLLRSRTRNENH